MDRVIFRRSFKLVDFPSSVERVLIVDVPLTSTPAVMFDRLRDLSVYRASLVSSSTRLLVCHQCGK